MKRSTKRRLKQAWRRDGEWISMALVVVLLASAGSFFASEAYSTFSNDLVAPDMGKYDVEYDALRGDFE